MLTAHVDRTVKVDTEIDSGSTHSASKTSTLPLARELDGGAHGRCDEGETRWGDPAREKSYSYILR